MLWLVHAGGVAYSVFIVGISALCCYEYALVLRLGGRPVQAVPTVLLGAALAACAALGAPLGLTAAVGVAGVSLVEMAAGTHSLDRAALTLFGAFFAGWMPAHLALIRDLRPYGESFAFLVFAAVWAMDTAAYAAGRSFGRNALASELSPKKTWEGAAAGFAAAVLVCLLFQRATGLRETLTPLHAALLGAVIGVSGQLSDLAESMVKRDAGIKDSGALLLCAPAVYYALTFRP
jgi:phosphatidate cytidylyltransferase